MKRKMIKLLLVVCVLTAVGSGGYLLYYYGTSYKSEADIDALRDMLQTGDSDGEEPDVSDTGEMQLPEIRAQFRSLYQENPDIVGWISIDDTEIDYPVMYSPNDSENGEYYLHRNFDGDYSAAGLPFVDRSCSIYPATDNVIIYGHNMNAGTMFHDLLQYEDSSFYEAHRTFSFDTIYESGEYEVVAFFRAQILPEGTDAFRYYTFVNAGTEEEFDRYVEEIKKASAVDTGVSVSYGDHLLTLSTCAYHVKDGRFAVIAKKIK